MQRTIDALREVFFDLLILGGGITGAGVALDGVLRGFRVGLIDKGDFASGTSSASSKLIHGGLRYLEHGGFHLVYEALHERRLLLENAPHLVHPLRFIIPFYEDSRVPTWKYRAGLTMYDLLAGASNLRRSRPLRFPHLRRECAGLRSVGLHGGACYVDAQMDDARLCLEVVHTAALQGACVANYVEAVGFEQRGGEITGVRALDRVSGAEFSIRARQIVNATGPWLDTVCRLAGDHTGPHLRPTKGIHVIAPDRGLTSAFLLLHPADGRVFFVIPWLGKTLIGTTDTLWEQSPDALMVADLDVEYTLAGYNHYFAPPLQRSDILNSFAGLRPLIRTRSGEPSSLSREFQLIWSPSGLLSVAGGKYTTYRRMAEIVTDAVARRFQRRRRSRTGNFRLHGAPGEAWEQFEPAAVSALCSRHGLDTQSARHLVGRYGQCALDVAAYLERDRTLAEPVLPDEPDLRVEFAYQRDHEMAIYPADHLLRRTRLGLFRPGLLPTALPKLGTAGSPFP
jgi:glycerol-3-phosphate dehydrogenase